MLSIDDGIVSVATDEAVLEFQHHWIDQIRRAVDLYGPEVEVRSKGVLSFGMIEIFSVKVHDGSPIGPCRIL